MDNVIVLTIGEKVQRMIIETMLSEHSLVLDPARSMRWRNEYE